MWKLLLLILVSPALLAAEPREEDFADLEAWKPLTFKRIARHSTYEVVREGERKVLLAKSDNAASGLLWTQRFSPYELPVLSWRWKIDQVLKKGDARYKAGDDFALRIAVVFKYDPGKAGIGQGIKYNAYRLMHGEYPPHSSLHYIWANRKHKQAALPNPHTPRTWLVIMRSGNDEAGAWVEESTNILEDYRRHFGEDPPHEATLAIMSDSDNTGESATARLDFLRLEPAEQAE